MRKKQELKYWIFLLLFLISFKTHDKNKTISNRLENVQIVNTKFLGTFSTTTQTEETTNGTAYITYSFVIENDKATLDTNSFHEPITCNGDYKGYYKNNVLELYYDGKENNCKSKKPNFIIKKIGRNYLIKGIGGEATINEWIKLRKIK